MKALAPSVLLAVVSCGGLLGGDDDSVPAIPVDAGAIDVQAEAPDSASCEAGSDCCDGHRVDLSGDPANCGGCRHDCLGGACKSGACQPVALVTHQNGAFGIAVDSSNVHFTTYAGASGGVLECAIGGCGNHPTTLAGQSGLYVAVDAASVYWTDGGGTVAKCAIGGCNSQPTTIASLASGENAGIAVDAKNVYWFDGGAVLECAVGGCNNQPTTLASGQGGPGVGNGEGIAVRAGILYWLTPDSVMTCPTAGCSDQPTALVSGRQLFRGRIAVDATNAYWTHDWNGAAWTVEKCALSGCNNHPTTIASGQDAVGIGVDATDVYWATFSGPSVMKCAIGGCNGQPTPLAKGAGDQAWNMALGSTAVFWTSTDGVMLVAK